MGDQIELEANQLNSAEVPEKVDLLCGNIPIMEVDGHCSMDFLGFRELHKTPEQSRSTDILSLVSFGSPWVTSRASNKSEILFADALCQSVLLAFPTDRTPERGKARPSAECTSAALSFRSFV